MVKGKGTTAAPKASSAKAGGGTVGEGGTSTGGRGPMSWKSFAVFAGVGTGLLAYYAREKERRMQGAYSPPDIAERPAPGVAVSER